MNETRVPLYNRLPEVYRIRDEEVRDQLHEQKGPLEAFLGLVEGAFGSIHANIESMGEDFFVELAADWAVPYIGDLLGTSHLSGDPWTLRADVADTIALRRRKGTLGAVQLLTFNLTRWGVRCVELRDNLVWAQNLNHQRPDIGGPPPYGQPTLTRNTPIRGGTVPLRDPALMSLIGTPFDPFGHIPDLKPHTDSAIRYNLPNLAIFLWRLKPFRVPLSRPSTAVVQTIAGAGPGEAARVVRFDVFALDRPVRLFQVQRLKSDLPLHPTERIALTQADEAPGPILMARLTDDTPAGNPGAYVSVRPYDASQSADGIVIGDEALQLHVPRAQFAATSWQFRGANLCAWEDGLDRPVGLHEIIIDPDIGRIVVGVATAAHANALRNHLLLTWTYGAPGEIGAHPVSRPAAPASLMWGEVAEPVEQPVRRFSFDSEPAGLKDRLDNLNSATEAVVIEINDSMVHDLDLSAVAGVLNQDGGPNLRLAHSLIIRAADNSRPIVRLAQPLRFRALDPGNANILVRLEGLYLTRGPSFPANLPLIARAAVDGLELHDCTLDTGRYRLRDESVSTDMQPSLVLRDGYGFPNPDIFDQTPAIRLRRTQSGPLWIDTGYTLDIRESIVDGGEGVLDAPGAAYAISAAANQATGWGPPLTVDGATFFGRVRVKEIDGRGGIWVGALEVLNNQIGCLKYSYFAGIGDRLSQNHACVHGTDARLRFVSEVAGDAAFGQLARNADFRVRERGPRDDQMGAFGFQVEAHKWRNLQIRYREFMPVGVRPLLIPVT